MTERINKDIYSGNAIREIESSADSNNGVDTKNAIQIDSAETDITKNMQEISSKTFADCDNLETIHITVNDYLYIENEAFFQCANLKEIIVKCSETDLIYISPKAIVECPMARFVFKNANTDAIISPILISKEKLLENVEIDDRINEEERLAIEKALIAFRARLPKLAGRYFPLGKTNIKIYFDGEITYEDHYAGRETGFKHILGEIQNIHCHRYDSEGDYQKISGLNYRDSKAMDELIDSIPRRFYWKKQIFLGKTLLKDADAMEDLVRFKKRIEKEERIIGNLRKYNNFKYNCIMNIVNDIERFVSSYTDIFDRYNIENSEIRINIKNIELILFKFNIYSECLSSMVQLYLVRGLYEAACFNTVGKIYEDDAKAIETCSRIVGAKAMWIYDEMEGLGFCGSKLSLLYQNGSIDRYPEVLCSRIDKCSNLENGNPYQLLCERLHQFATACYLQILIYVLGKSENIQGCRGNAGEFVRAYRYYHPEKTLLQVINALHWVEESHLQQAGIPKEEIKKQDIILTYFRESDDSPETVIVDNHVRCIRKHAFAYCHNLKKLIIYNDDELIIEPFAFFATALERIEIYGSGKIIIADFAFRNSDKLTNVLFEQWNDETCHISEFAFAGCSFQLIVSTMPGKADKECTKYKFSPKKSFGYEDLLINDRVCVESMCCLDRREKEIRVDKTLDRIHSLAYCYDPFVEKITISSIQITIDPYAFYELPSLKTIEFSCEPFYQKISKMAFYGIEECKFVYNGIHKGEREGELFEEAISDIFTGKMDEEKPDNIEVSDDVDFKNEYLKWVCCCKAWKRKTEIVDFINFYFPEIGCDDVSKFEISENSFSQEGSQLIPEFNIDKIGELCDVGLFSKEKYKKDIASALRGFKNDTIYKGREIKAAKELNELLFLKKDERKTLMELSVEDEELHQLLKQLQNQISICLNYDNERFIDFDMGEQRTHIYFSQFYKNIFKHKKTIDLSFALDLLEFAVAFGLSAQRLFKLYEKCDCQQFKKAATVKGCAYAIAMNYLYHKEDKTAYEIMLHEGEKGVFPYWPYALRGQLLYQCFDNQNNYNELLKDIIEKAQKKPLESVETVFKLCCVEEDPNLCDLIF